MSGERSEGGIPAMFCTEAMREMRTPTKEGSWGERTWKFLTLTGLGGMVAVGVRVRVRVVLLLLLTMLWLLSLMMMEFMGERLLDFLVEVGDTTWVGWRDPSVSSWFSPVLGGAGHGRVLTCWCWFCDVSICVLLFLVVCYIGVVLV